MTVAEEPTVRLTDRQLEAARLMAQGLSDDEIADVMGIRPRTVKYHLEGVRNKLRLNYRREIPYALQQQGYKVYEG